MGRTWCAVAGTDVMPLLYRGFTMRTLDIAGFEHLYQDRAGVEDSASGTGGIYALPEFVATTGPSLVSGREFSYADVAGARSSPSSVKPSPVSSLPAGIPQGWKATTRPFIANTPSSTGGWR